MRVPLLYSYHPRLKKDRALIALIIFALVSGVAMNVVSCKRSASQQSPAPTHVQTIASTTGQHAGSSPNTSAVPANSGQAANTDGPRASFQKYTQHDTQQNTQPGAPDGQYHELTWEFNVASIGKMSVVVVIPKHASDTHRLPVVVTMHGLGESRKGSQKGARGWVDDYWLGRALRRVVHPPLTGDDFRGRFDRHELSRINSRLEQQPYQGLIVVCPYTPFEVLQGEKAFEDGKVLADFIVDTLLVRVYAQTPAIGTAQTTGVDGVSLGGRAAVLVGLSRPEAFGVIGALQPAFDVQDARRLADKAVLAKKRNPLLGISLLTSTQDYYLASTKAISEAFTSSGVPNSLTIVPGDHSYDFNRGPGVYHMLLLHDRALRGQSPAF